MECVSTGNAKSRRAAGFPRLFHAPRTPDGAGRRTGTRFRPRARRRRGGGRRACAACVGGAGRMAAPGRLLGARPRAEDADRGEGDELEDAFPEGNAARLPCAERTEDQKHRNHRKQLEQIADMIEQFHPDAFLPPRRPFPGGRPPARKRRRPDCRKTTIVCIFNIQQLMVVVKLFYNFFDYLD